MVTQISFTIDTSEPEVEELTFTDKDLNAKATKLAQKLHFK